MKKYIISAVILILISLSAYYFIDQLKTEDNNMEETSENFKEVLNLRAALETNMGNIMIEFYPKDAPKTVTNFIGLAKKGYYDGVSFHRVVSGFVIQGGDPTGTGAGGDSIYGGDFEDELNPNTESYQRGYLKGAVAMANRGPDTNSSQFFIMLENKSLPNLYTIFGKVVAGDDIVQNIGRVKVGANDKPLEPVIINKVIVEE